VDLEDFGRVADAALLQIESLLKDWFPAGVIDGHEFCIGSRSGEAGKSMRIRLTGPKAGYWSDFSSDGDAGRDLISLYAFIHSLSQGKACAALARELGVQLAGAQTAIASSSKVVNSTSPQKSAPAQARQGVEEKTKGGPRSDWVPVLPVPIDAPTYPVAHVKRGRPEKLWEYKDQQRRLLGVIYRFRTSTGGKEVLPCVYAEHSITGKRDWRWMQFPEPRPLYLPGALRPEFPVLIVEGEKCADTAYEMLLDSWDVASWPGGGKAVLKADWSALAGRRVVLWPDADAKTFKDGHVMAGQIMPEAEQPGMSTMLKLSEHLQGLGSVVRMVDIPGPDAAHGGFQVDDDGHDGWDIHDLITGGADRAEVDAWLERLRPDDSDEIETSPAEDAEGVPEWVTSGPESDQAQNSNVVPLRLVPRDDEGRNAASTPSSASARGMKRSAIREKMIGAGMGGVKGCRENVYIALKYDALLVGLVALDQFALLQVKRKNPPWSSEPGEWNEGDDFQLGMYLAEHYGLVIAAVGDIEKAVAQIARENGFNPVIDLFEDCAERWDGVPRVAEAFATYWGATASEYLSLVSTMFFVGLAKRAYVPGIKHDDAPVFEGSQGEGKSTALSILGGEWFADTPFRMGEKDGYLSIQGILIYEIAELEQFNRSEVTAVKAFMSSQKDRYREPYGRRMKNQPRRTVFAATTNENQYFKDPTGNRRFWPVDTGRLDLDGLRRDREQLFGEAVHMMRAGVKWYPTREQQRDIIGPQQSSREIWDEWTGRIWEYLEGLDTDGNPTRAERIMRITGRELLTRALHIEIGKISNAKTETMRISNIMRKLGWEKRRDTTGAREFYYARPEDRPVAQAEGIDAGKDGEDDDLPI
jgi:predicted P-loop ATPase